MQLDPYATPRGSFQYPIPVIDSDPDDGDLVTICLNPAWLPVIIGCLKQLLLESTWDTDDPAIMQLVQERVYGLIGLFQSGVCGLFQIRACTLDCGIEYSTDGGDTWTCISLASCIGDISDTRTRDIIDGMLSDGTLQHGGVSEPGPAPAPIPGSCQTYHVILSAKDVWLCPSPVNSGDSLRVSNPIGGWYDGGVAGKWYCPNGDWYALGTCQGPSDYVTGDPINTLPHMSLIGHVVSTYFDPITSSYVVPSATVNQPFYLQANDSVLTDNQGSIEFDVEVCTGGWTHVFDFSDGDIHGWTFDAEEVGHDGYIDSSGVHAGDIESSGTWYRQLKMAVAFASSHITHLSVHGNYTRGGGASSWAWGWQKQAHNTLVWSATYPSNGWDTIPAWAGADTMTGIELQVQVSSEGVSGSFNVLSITVSGDGTEPTWD